MPYLSKIYTDMWEQFIVAMAHNQYELDTWIENPSDNRRGVTALAFLEANNKSVSSAIGRFLNQVKQREPHQYYQPENELHVTVLSIISCIAGFTVDDITPERYVDVFNHSMHGVGPIEIKFQGMTASPACILIQGFPIGEGLNQLRENLRRNFKQSGLYSSIDSRYKIATAHVTAVRFCSPITDTSSLISLCEKYREYQFGSMFLTDFELVFNDWYQRSAVTKQLGQYSAKSVINKAMV